MKKELYILTTMLIVGMAVAAPKIQFKETEYDFEKVERGTKVTHYFEFKNVGDEPLHINQVRATCGCTAALATKKVLQPGETGKIRAQFNSRGYAGRITKRVIVKTDDPDNPVINLIITGEVTVPFRVVPRHISFGFIKSDSIPAETVRIYFSKRETKVESLTTVGDFLEVENLGQKDSVFTFVATVKKGTNPGNLFGRVNIFTNNSLDPRIIVAVTGKVVGDVETVPSMLSLGGARGRVRKNVELRIIYNKNKIKGIKVDSLFIEDTTLTAEIDSVQDTGGEVLIKFHVKISENAPVGRLDTRLRLFTNYKEKPEFVIPVIGFIR